MASINQLISEVSNKYGQPLNHNLKETAKSAIIHLRNQEIRRSYSGNSYSDQHLKQMYRVSLKAVQMDDFIAVADTRYSFRRTNQKVLRPTRLVNNVPFHSIRTDVSFDTVVLPFIQSDRLKYYLATKTMNNIPSYTYMNDYVYLFNLPAKSTNIVIEGIFERPEEVDVTIYGQTPASNEYFDDYEYFIPEDMIPSILNQLYHSLGIGSARENFLVDGDTRND